MELVEDQDGPGFSLSYALEFFWFFFCNPQPLIQEGFFSIVVGLLGFFVVPSTPYDSKFLTENQK